MTRVVVFVDEQNVYRDIRRALFQDYDVPQMGQLSPRLLAQLLVDRRPDPPRELQQIRVYTGRPSEAHDAQTYWAHMRQSSAWERDALTRLKWRMLRYPPSYPQVPPRQKGIDVHLAVDMVRMYVEDKYDVAILASTDTDLVPALEALFELDRGKGYAPVEVAAWITELQPKRLRVRGHQMWCHELAFADYQKIADRTDYNIAK
ncbi:MAG TPA: NYN domain-containing protein [Gaiellaceae bacterium]